MFSFSGLFRSLFGYFPNASVTFLTLFCQAHFAGLLLRQGEQIVMNCREAAFDRLL